MGDGADRAMEIEEEAYFEYLHQCARARGLSDAELVAEMDTYHKDDEEGDYEEILTACPLGISEWYHRTGFLTKRQREAMVSVVGCLWSVP